MNQKVYLEKLLAAEFYGPLTQKCQFWSDWITEWGKSGQKQDGIPSFRGQTERGYKKTEPDPNT